MGMESYFVHLLPLSVVPIKIDGGNSFKGKGESTVQSLLSIISQLFPTESRGNYWLVDGALKLVVGEEEGYVREITLEGCFAWYEEGLGLMYRIAKAINAKQQVRLFHPLGVEGSLTSEEEFRADMKRLYSDKYLTFTKQFPGIHSKVPPDQEFFKLISSPVKRRVTEILRRLFRPG